MITEYTRSDNFKRNHIYIFVSKLTITSVVMWLYSLLVKFLQRWSYCFQNRNHIHYSILNKESFLHITHKKTPIYSGKDVEQSAQLVKDFAQLGPLPAIILYINNTVLVGIDHTYLHFFAYEGIQINLTSQTTKRIPRSHANNLRILHVPDAINLINNPPTFYFMFWWTNGSCQLQSTLDPVFLESWQVGV